MPAQFNDSKLNGFLTQLRDACKPAHRVNANGWRQRQAYCF